MRLDEAASPRDRRTEPAPTNSRWTKFAWASKNEIVRLAEPIYYANFMSSRCWKPAFVQIAGSRQNQRQGGRGDVIFLVGRFEKLLETALAWACRWPSEYQWPWPVALR